MDTELLRTFLELNRTRHFGHTADNLCLSQSAVSARIRLLEDTIGAPLFTRNRNDIQLTAAGQKLIPFAEHLVLTWNRARHEVVLDEAIQSSLLIGAVPSLWDIRLQDWLAQVSETMPELALSAEVQNQDWLLRQVRDRMLDLAFTFEAPQSGDLEVRDLGVVSLILVASHAGLSPTEAMGAGYILVDWGTSFSFAHARHFPGSPAARLRMNLGRMARAFLLQSGGSAYLAEDMVAGDIRARRLYKVKGAPVIERRAYALFPSDSEKRSVIDQVLAIYNQADKQPASLAPVY